MIICISSELLSRGGIFKTIQCNYIYYLSRNFGRYLEISSFTLVCFLTDSSEKVLIKVLNYFLNFPSECASSGFRQMHAAGIQIVLDADLKLNFFIPGSDLQDFTIDLPWSIFPIF